MADDADAARKERMADYRVGGRHLVHLGPDVLSRDAMQKERALTPLGEESAQRDSFASSAPSQKSPRSSLTSTPRALVKRVSKRLQRMGIRTRDASQLVSGQSGVPGRPPNSSHVPAREL